MIRVLVPLADGFEEIEAVSIIDVLRRGGIEVIAASLGQNLSIKGAHGVVVMAEVEITAVATEALDMVVLPGGWDGTLAALASALFLAGCATGLQPTLDDVRAQVRGGDDDGIGEIHHPALAVGEPPVVEHLQQDVVDVGVSLLDLVQQQHAVGLATHLLGELAALVIAHITRRRAHQACHGMAFPVLGHVYAQQRTFIAIDGLGQRLGELGLAHAGRPEEQKSRHRLAALLVGNQRDGLARADAWILGLLGAALFARLLDLLAGARLQALALGGALALTTFLGTGI